MTEISPASFLCHRATGSILLASSRDVGWTSLLIDHTAIPVGGSPVFETLATPDQTLVVMLSGEQQLQVASSGVWRTAVYHAGTIGLTPHGCVDRIRRTEVKGRPRARKVNIYVPDATFEEARDEFRRMARCPPRLNDLSFRDPATYSLALSLLDAAADGTPSLFADAAAHWLAAHVMLRGWGRASGDTPGFAFPSLTDRRLARTLEFMSAHFAEPLSLDRLAREASISKFHLVRSFREKTGRTPFAVLAEIRLDAARAMLVGTDLPISAIASRCGYRQTSHLTVAFKRHLRATPSQYRAVESRAISTA